MLVRIIGFKKINFRKKKKKKKKEKEVRVKIMTMCTRTARMMCTEITALDCICTNDVSIARRGGETFKWRWCSPGRAVAMAVQEAGKKKKKRG